MKNKSLLLMIYTENEPIADLILYTFHAVDTCTIV